MEAIDLGASCTQGIGCFAGCFRQLESQDKSNKFFDADLFFHSAEGQQAPLCVFLSFFLLENRPQAWKALHKALLMREWVSEWKSERETERDRERHGETRRDTERHRETQRDTERHRETQRHAKRRKEMQRDAKRHKETQRDTKRHRETQRERRKTEGASNEEQRANICWQGRRHASEKPHFIRSRCAG